MQTALAGAPPLCYNWNRKRLPDNIRQSNSFITEERKMTMRKTEKCKCKLKKPLIILLVLAVLAFIGWLVYYFFFAKDYEELDETLFEGKEKEPVTEQPAEEKAEENCAEEAVQEACSPEAEPAEEPVAEV